MGLNGLEPSTSRLSGVRSNQLSYRPDQALLSFESRPLKTEQSFYAGSVGQLTLTSSDRFLRKEVIQPQVLLRLPCYDFTLIICPTLDG